MTGGGGKWPVVSRHCSQERSAGHETLGMGALALFVEAHKWPNMEAYEWSITVVTTTVLTRVVCKTIFPHRQVESVEDVAAGQLKGARGVVTESAKYSG